MNLDFVSIEGESPAEIEQLDAVVEVLGKASTVLMDLVTDYWLNPSSYQYQASIELIKSLKESQTQLRTEIALMKIRSQFGDEEEVASVLEGIVEETCEKYSKAIPQADGDSGEEID